MLTIFGSTISSARQDVQDKRRSRGPQGTFRTHQEATWYRLTVRRACGQLSRSETTVWRPVFSKFSLPQDKGGFGHGQAVAQADPQEGQARYRYSRAECTPALCAKAPPYGAGVRLDTTSLPFCSTSSVPTTDVHAETQKYKNTQHAWRQRDQVQLSAGPVYPTHDDNNYCFSLSFSLGCIDFETARPLWQNGG